MVLLLYPMRSSRSTRTIARRAQDDILKELGYYSQWEIALLAAVGSVPEKQQTIRPVSARRAARGRSAASGESTTTTYTPPLALSKALPMQKLLNVHKGVGCSSCSFDRF